MIREVFYKDRPALEVACEEFKACFLPKDGGKMASFQDKDGFEFLLQTQGENYRRLSLDGDFEKSECSGFDDMFPTIDPCEIRGLAYLDHGEVCRHEFEVKKDGEKVKFSCFLEKLDILYEKTVYAKDGALFLDYHVQNRSEFDFEYLWAGHILIRGEEGALAFSDLDGTPRKIVAGCPLSEENAHVLPPKTHKHYKYYHTEAKQDLRCGAFYPQSQKTLLVECAGEAVKYFGAWVNAGDLNGAYTIALEPCTALFDDPIHAKEACASSCIKAGGSVRFTLKMSCR